MFIALTLLAGAALAQDVSYVDATSLRVRAEPTTQSPILAHTPRGADLAIEEIRGSWARVSIARGPDRVMQGWVSTDYLSTTPVATAPLPGPIYVARCESLTRTVLVNGRHLELAEHRAKLLGRWSPGNGVEDMTFGGSWSGTEAIRDDLPAEVASRRWYLARGGDPRHSDDTYRDGLPWQWFVAPFWTDSWNEQDANAYGTTSDESYEKSLVLGPCAHPGEIYTTVELERLEPEPVSVADTVAALGALEGVKAGTLFGADLRRPFADRDFVSVELEVPWEYSDCGGELHTDPTHAFVLLKGGEPVAAFGGGLGQAQEGGDPPGASGARWYTATVDGQQRVLGVLGAWYEFGDGASLLDLDPVTGAVHTAHIMTETWGC